MSITAYAVKASDGSEYNSIAMNRPASGTGGNGGSVARGGSGSTKLDIVDVYRHNTDVFASTILNNGHIDKANSSGTLAYNDSVPVAPRINRTTLAGGLSNTYLRSGATTPANIQSIHLIQAVHTRRASTAFRAGEFNLVTGLWGSGYPVTATDTFATDNAAVPTRAVPGQLVYKLGQPAPITDDYTAKNG